MREPNTCPICKKEFGLGKKGWTNLKMHVAKKEDPYHKLLRRHQQRWPGAPLRIAIMELQPQLQQIKAQYGPPKHYTEEHVIHEDDPFLELED